MSQNQITSSRLNILKNCQAMRVLPWYEDVGKDAQRGTRIHEGIVKRLNGEPSMLEQEEEQCVSSAIAWLNQQGYENVQTEVAYSLSPDGTTRRILTTKHRDYGPLLPGEVPGTLDVVADHRAVIDWKSGQETEEPHLNWQMLFGGAALAKVYSLDEVELILAYVRSDHVWAVRAKVPRLTLDAFRAQLHHLMTQEGIPMPGQHCRYCPAAAACPAQRKALATFGGSAQWTTEYVSELNDSLMVEQLPGLKAAVEAVEKSLKLRAGTEGIHLSDGSIWKQKVRVMPRFNRAKAEGFLTPEQAAECVEKREELYFTKVKA